MPRKYPDETKQEAASILQIHHAIPIAPDSLSTLSVLSENVFSLSANGQRRTKFKPKPNQRGASLMTKSCRQTRDIAAAHAKYLAARCVVAPPPDGRCLRDLMLRGGAGG